jgi:lactate dehydrogenase-like 2-hydroxyacid dehydrogenase
LANGRTTLAQRVDVLVVAAAGGSATRKLVNRTVIDALGYDGYLVNIARGSVVDEDALVDALSMGGLAGSGTVETRAAMEALTLRNLDSFLASGELVTPVPLPAAASG